MSDQLKVGDDVNVCEYDGTRVIYRARIIRETKTQWVVAHVDHLDSEYPCRFAKKDLHLLGQPAYRSRSIKKAVPR